MRSRGKGVDTSDEVSAAQASLTVCFQPASTRNPDRSMATRSLVTGVKCLRFDRAETGSDGGDHGEDPTV